MNPAASPASTTTHEGTKILKSEDGRGNSTVALRAFAKGELIFREPPLALVYSSYDPPWLKTMRADLERQNSACAWQLCVAVHCLTEEELPKPAPEGLVAMDSQARRLMEELCGVDYPDELEPSELAQTTTRHLMGATLANGATPIVTDSAALGRTLDILGAHISRNGFQIMDLSRRPPTAADGLFHRISFCNHCCASLNNASWTWDGKDGLLSLKAARDIVEGEELTISYIAKPWCDLGKPARQKYLEQNFNFTCLCKACTLPAEEEELLRKQLASKRNANSKPAGKLAGLLQRWMEEGNEMPRDDDDDTKGKSSQSDAPAPKKEKMTKPLTDEDRLARIYQRCEGEGFQVSAKEAEAALLAEDGHVGKTMIRLRRQRREAGSEAAVSGGMASADGVASGAPAAEDKGQLLPRQRHTPCGAVALSIAALAIALSVLARCRPKK